MKLKACESMRNFDASASPKADLLSVACLASPLCHTHRDDLRKAQLFRRGTDKVRNDSINTPALVRLLQSRSWYGSVKKVIDFLS